MSMGGNFLGMDIAAVRQLATQMTAAANTINDTMTKLTSQLQAADWRGPDATKFRNDWQSLHCQHLKSVIQELTDASTRANQNALQQEQASA
jgi:uncharacterized protein YukE